LTPLSSSNDAPGDVVELDRALAGQPLFRPPAPFPRDRAPGLFELLAILRRNPLEAWTRAHFEEPVVFDKYPLGRIATVSDPEAIRRVLLDNAANYQKDTLQKRILSAGLAGGLLTAEGDDWRAQRRTLAPLFSARAVDGFAPAMLAGARAMLERWRARPGDEPLDISAEMGRLTLDVLVRTIFSDGLGGDADTMREAMRVYFDTIGTIDPFDILGLPSFVPRPTRLRVRSTLAVFDRAVDAIIAARARRRRDAPRDILDLLLEARDPETGVGMSEASVRANIVTFIAAGHETTSNALAWSIYLLSRAPGWRAAVAAEAEDAPEARRGDMDRLPVARAVVEESMRLYPPLVAMSRQAVQADVLAGSKIAPGDMVVVSPYILHRRRGSFDNPDMFDPGRFLPGRRESIGRYDYLPFGAGPRVCIGMAFARQEAAIVLGEICRSVDLVVAPGHEVKPLHRMTLRPMDGLPMLARWKDSA
jgi:cytochrome P450